MVPADRGGRLVRGPGRHQQPRGRHHPGAARRILDRNGVPLVDNRESIVVGIAKQDFDELSDGKQDALVERLAQALSFAKPVPDQITADDIRKKLDDPRFTKFRPIPIAEDLTPEEEIYFAEQADRYPTVSVEHTTVREYPYGTLAAHVLGYVGPLNDDQWQEISEDNDPKKPYVQTDEIGKAGVEAAYEPYLRGTPGRQVFEVDRRGAVVRELDDERVEPKPGDDLYLSIDVHVQAETEEALRDGLATRRQTPGELGLYPAEAGASTIIDPQNGQVVAMASYPTYDPTDLVGGISCPVWRDLQGLPAEGECGVAMTREIERLTKDGTPPVAKLLNRAIQGTYPAGSTFKLASSYAALKLNLIRPDDYFNDPGYYDIPGCTGGPDVCRVSSPSAENGGVGAVDLARAITVSSDSYFYKIGNDSWAAYKQRDRVGPTAFQDAVEELGYGSTTGIELRPEASGRIPDPDWLKELDEQINGGATERGRWGSGNSINMAIGQGDVLITPLQNANAYAAFANGGTLYTPSLLAKVTASRQPDAIHLAFEPDPIRTIDFGPAHDDLMRGFEGVTRGDDGYATAARAFQGFPFSTWSPAGKTGTAETGTDKKPKEDHSWFVGFGPSRDARYAASMLMEHSGAGGSASAPAIRRIFEAIATGTVDDVDLSAFGGSGDGTELPTEGDAFAPDENGGYPTGTTTVPGSGN
ncbi:MAG: penicillin-binding transpeptidase domain-containing protein [Acidimicrobiales bacterium]